MKPDELLTLVKQPELLRREHIAPLEQLAAEFPYFQPAHLLLSLAGRKWDAGAYQRSLKRTAIVVPNRAHFFNLVHALESGERVAEFALDKSQHPDLSVIKAAELTVEGPVASPTPAAPVPEKPLNAPADPRPTDPLEEGIALEVVHARVEKELAETVKEPVETPSAASFSDWLSLLKKNNGQNLRRVQDKPVREVTESVEPARPAEPVSQNPQSRQKKQAIIDKIIETNPGLIRGKEDQKFYRPDIHARESLLENEHLMTETLARIYALQGNLAKAIRAYEILSLKNPQKSAYFAALIQQLKTNKPSE